MWSTYINAHSIEETLSLLSNYQGNARLIAGGTDLMNEFEQGVRREIDTLIDISRIEGLDQITLDENDHVHIGPLVTHNHCIASRIISGYAYPLARAAWEVGSPQIRNRGTIAGNLITASPANDTITPLIALDAKLTLKSQKRVRIIDLKEFYTGVRKTILEPDEMLIDISFPAMKANQKGSFIKFALRRAQAISVINIAAILGIDGESVVSAAIALGAVAPTIIRAEKAEQYLCGKKLDDVVIEEAGCLIMDAAKPISDLRSSSNYRSKIVRVIGKRSLENIRDNKEKDGFPEEPIFLWGKAPYRVHGLEKTSVHTNEIEIITTINGKTHRFKTRPDKSLMRMLREEGLLTGTKEGCGEGECGACTLFLDGAAVMSCLVPAPRAHQANIVTIEGIGSAESLHIVQQKFIDEGAVQCGYCTPGFIMSAVKLLEERSDPNIDQIKQAITGNLCRCTGYYQIISAIAAAARESQ